MSRSQKWRQEWSFFIGDSGRRKYNRLYSLRSFFFSAEISVDFGTCLNARKTNQEPLSMPGLGIGRGSFFVSFP